MTIAHYDALTARAFERHDANLDAGTPAADRDTVALHNEHMKQVSKAVAAVGRVLFHLGVWGAGMTALWLSSAP